MERFVYNLIESGEKDDWWYRVMRKVVWNYLDWFGGESSGTLLDIGCGTGYTLMELKKRGWKTYGIEIEKKMVEKAKSLGLDQVKEGDAVKLPWSQNKFDAVLMLDVLEHVREEEKALAEAYRVLKQGGILILNCPAYNWLWSYHDDSAKHMRRYTRRQLKQKVIKTGFSIDKATYLNWLLFPIVAGVRLVSRLGRGKAAKSDVGRVPFWARSWLYIIFSSELRVLKYINFPYGLSVSIVAKKR